MNLINQLFFATLISSVTSTLLLIVWWMLRNFFMLVNAKLIYTTLRWICLMYLLPIGYVAILITYKNWFEGQDELWKLAFAYSRNFVAPLKIIACLWFVVSGFLLLRYTAGRIEWKRKLADNIPEFDPAAARIFQKVCKDFGIPEGKLELQRNTEVDMPLVTGWLRPQVVLPQEDYTEEDLEIIFYHELSHHKQGDLKYKTLAVVVMLVHCFNPAAYLILRMLNLWSECMADVSALEASGNLHHSEPYFASIMRLIPNEEKKQDISPFISALKKDDKIFVRRVDFMKKYQRVKAAGKVFTAVFAAVFVLASASTAYGSAKIMADVQSAVYQKVEERTNMDVARGLEVGKDFVADDGTVIHYVRVEDLNMDGMVEVSTPDEDVVSFATGDHYNFAWVVNPNTRHVSGEFYVRKGQKMVTVAAVSPSNKKYWLGIMDDDGSAWYVERSGGASYTFPITETNDYRVFIQNNYTDSTTLNATGSFYYED